MAVDLSDPSIAQAYRQLNDPAFSLEWLILGYKGTANGLALVDAGAEGLEGLRTRLAPADVHFGLLKLEGRLVAWNLIPSAVGGVKRARALVHARAVASAFHAGRHIFNASSPDDFEFETIRSRTLSNSPNPQHTPPTQHSSSPSHSPTPHDPRRFPTDQFVASPASTHFKPPSPLPNGIVAGTSNLSLRSNSPRQATISGSNPASPAAPYSPPPQQQHQTFSGYPSALGAPTSPPAQYPSSDFSPTGTPAYGSFPARKASLTPSLPYSSATSHLREPALSASVPAAATYAPPIFSPPPQSLDPAASYQHQPHDRSTSSASASGLFDSAAAMMLAPHTPDPSSSSAPSPPRPHFPAGLASTTSLKPSVQSLPVDVLPGEEDEEDPGAAAAAADVAARQAREEAARQERERRERALVEERMRRAEEEAEVERVRRAEEAERERMRREEEERRREEEESRRRGEDEAARVAEAERVKLEEEERRAEEARLAEEARIRAEEEARVAEEAERLRLEEEERTRAAEEEMRLLIERQRLEKRLREEEEARKAEEERERRKEEMRRGLVERRERGEAMLSGKVSVQGGNSMLWKRRHFQLSSSGLALFKNESETDHPLETVPMSHIAHLTVAVEGAFANAFKIEHQDGDEHSFYTDTRDEKEMLVAAIRCAARMA